MKFYLGDQIHQRLQLVFLGLSFKRKNILIELSLLVGDVKGFCRFVKEKNMNLALDVDLNRKHTFVVMLKGLCVFFFDGVVNYFVYSRSNKKLRSL